MQNVGFKWFATSGLLLLLLAGCASAPKPSARVALPGKADTPKSEKPPAVSSTRPGGYYQDDGPDDNPPLNLEAVPDAEPKPEPLHKFANRPYNVLGQNYVPDTSGKPYQAQGIASWYGKKFHGQKTSSGEPYDMYGMSAAHPTLPIPSYVRVTNILNGKSVIVRINDRGPFHADRVIDLSYTAAYKLDLIRNGSGKVEISSIDPNTWVATSRTTAPEPEQSAAVTASEQSAAEPGYWLQIAAFSVRANAEQMLTRLRTEVATLADTLRIQTSNGVHRLRAGPFKSSTDAEEAAARLKQLGDVQPLLLR